jgi:hypothetical protein
MDNQAATMMNGFKLTVKLKKVKQARYLSILLMH